MNDLFGMANGDIPSTHDETLCNGEVCCIHNPSNHSLNDRPLRWISGEYLMERVCVCGVGHPDPDHIRHIVRRLGAAAALHQAQHVCCEKKCCGDDISSEGAL